MVGARCEIERTGVERDQVHPRIEPLAELREQRGLRVGVVLSLDQGPLQEHRPRRPRDRRAQGGQIELPGDREQRQPRLLLERVQAHRQVRLGARIELIHPRDDAHRAHRDPPLGHREPGLLAQHRDRAQHLLEVIERLAHPHVDDVLRDGRVAALLAQVLSRDRDLRDDLPRGQVAHEAQPPGLAEDAAARAAHLARDADGEPLPLARPVAAFGLRDQHRLHQRAVVERDREAHRAIGIGERLGLREPLVELARGRVQQGPRRRLARAHRPLGGARQHRPRERPRRALGRAARPRPLSEPGLRHSQQMLHGLLLARLPRAAGAPSTRESPDPRFADRSPLSLSRCRPRRCSAR